jgi:hypothetical protein
MAYTIKDAAGFSRFASALCEHKSWPDLSGSAVKMLATLAGMPQNALGYIEASVSQCAAASGLSRNTANQALRDLRAAGFLRAMPLGSFDNKHKRPSIWLITL